MADKEPKHATVFDTDQQQLGDVYAKALLGFGQKSGKVDSLIDELDGVANVVNKLPKLKSALESPRIAFAQKEKLLNKAFGKKISKEFMQFMKVLGGKGRFDCLSAVNSSAKKMHDEMSGKVQATITTAEKVDSSVKDDVASKLEKLLGRKVQVKATVDPEIIGGMIVRVGDTVYDGSVVSQLAQVRSKAIERTSDAIRGAMDKFTSN